MIKIPKSLDELKQMVSDANVNELIGQVKSTVGAVASATGTKAASALPGNEAFAKLRSLQQEEVSALNDVERYIESLQKQIADLQGQLNALKPAEPVKQEASGAPAETKTDK